MRYLLIFLSMTPSAFAYDQDMLQEALANCHKNQRTENVCASHQKKLADEELNKVYQTQLNRLNNNNDKSRLQSAQRAWIKYRDANCSYEARGSTEEGGSKFPMEYDLCIERVTKQRTAEIKGFIKCTYNGCPE